MPWRLASCRSCPSMFPSDFGGGTWIDRMDKMRQEAEQVCSESRDARPSHLPSLLRLESARLSGLPGTPRVTHLSPGRLMLQSPPSGSFNSEICLSFCLPGSKLGSSTPAGSGQRWIMCLPRVPPQRIGVLQWKPPPEARNAVAVCRETVKGGWLGRRSGWRPRLFAPGLLSLLPSTQFFRLRAAPSLT
jgi:hypothetical protein